VGDDEAGREQTRDGALARLAGREVGADGVPLTGDAVEELGAARATVREQAREPFEIGRVFARSREVAAHGGPDAVGELDVLVGGRAGGAVAGDAQGEEAGGPGAPLGEQPM